MGLFNSISKGFNKMQFKSMLADAAKDGEISQSERRSLLEKAVKAGISEEDALEIMEETARERREAIARYQSFIRSIMLDNFGQVMKNDYEKCKELAHNCGRSYHYEEDLMSLFGNRCLVNIKKLEYEKEFRRNLSYTSNPNANVDIDAVIFEIKEDALKYGMSQMEIDELIYSIQSGRTCMNSQNMTGAQNAMYGGNNNGMMGNRAMPGNSPSAFMSGRTPNQNPNPRMGGGNMGYQSALRSMQLGSGSQISPSAYNEMKSVAAQCGLLGTFEQDLMSQYGSRCLADVKMQELRAMVRQAYSDGFLDNDEARRIVMMGRNCGLTDMEIRSILAEGQMGDFRW